jgi:molybdopterin/thiamine biosynthesis adenylyltransferase
MVLRAPSSALRQLHQQLFDRAPQEAAAFLSVEPSGADLVLREVHTFSDAEMTDRGGELSLEERAQMRALAGIKRSGHALVEVHTHPRTSESVAFSALDEIELAEFSRYISRKLPGRPFGALVFGPAAYCGRAWLDGRQAALVLKSVGEALSVPEWASAPTSNGAHWRYDRQLRALGPAGQARIAGLRVGVVGAGGTGSVVAQQLVHLGVSELIVVDPDRVAWTNLPRLAGARRIDALLRTRKTRVVRRVARHVGGSSTHVLCVGDLRSARALSLLQSVDLVVGCVDNDGARLVLTELAAAHLVPYLDIGVGVERTTNGASGAIGGRLAFFVPGGPCLHCADELDESEAAEDLAPAALHALRVTRGYADDRRIEPALMPLNTAVAGLGMLELLAFVAGTRPVVAFQRFDAVGQRLVTVHVTRDPECPLCGLANGMGDRQDVERYARTADRQPSPLRRLLRR